MVMLRRYYCPTDGILQVQQEFYRLQPPAEHTSNSQSNFPDSSNAQVSRSENRIRLPNGSDG